MGPGVHEDWGVLRDRWRGVRSERVRVGPVDAHVLRVDGAVDGTPQLLVHGLGGSAAIWLEVAVELARHGPVVAPDLPGFGATPLPTGGHARLPALRAFLRALLGTLGWERAVVHGNSLGGAVVVQLTDRHPELVERLVLSAPALPTRHRNVLRVPPRSLATFLPFLVPGVGRMLLRRAYRIFDAEQLWALGAPQVHAYPDRLPPELARVIVDNLERGRAPWRQRAFTQATRSLISELVLARPLLGAVDRLQPPTLLVVGAADPLVVRVFTDEAARRRPDWPTVRLPAGHCPQAELPDEYLHAVRSWMAAASPPAAEAQPASTTDRQQAPDLDQV